MQLLKKIRVCFWVIIPAIFLTGCLSPVTLPQKKLYVLSPMVDKVTTAHRVDKTLLVMTTQANNALDTKKMAYVTKPYQLSYFADHGWASEPNDQLTLLIASALRDSHFFKAVVITPYVGSTDYRLSTHLSLLQQNFLFKPSIEQLRLSAQLINSTTGKAFSGKTFYYAIKTKQNTPYGGVVAANIATQKMLKDLTRFVIQSLKN